MKKIIPLFMSAFLLSGCSSNPIKKVVNHKYINTRFFPKEISQTGVNNLDITITPIDAASINKQTFELAMLDGNYEKEFGSQYDISNEEIKKMTPKEKAILEGKTNALKLLDDLVRNDKLPNSISYQLKRRIWSGENFGNDGTEIRSLSSIDNYVSDFNPYKIENRYLSVFKIALHNKDKLNRDVKIKQLQILNGEELLYPLGVDYLSGSHKERPSLAKNIFRLNMPDEIVVTPGQTVSKYIAIPAINTKNDKVTLEYINSDSSIPFPFRIEVENLEREYTLERFHIKNTKITPPNAYQYYYAIETKSGISFPTIDPSFYLDKDSKEEYFIVHAIAVGLKGSRIYYSTSGQLNARSVKRNVVLVDFKSPAVVRRDF